MSNATCVSRLYIPDIFFGFLLYLFIQNWHPKNLYFHMTHLIPIYNMFLGNTNHDNQCSKTYYCTEVNYSFFVKIKNYTLAWHFDCIITFCELAFNSEKNIEILTVYLTKTDTQSKDKKDKHVYTNTTHQTKHRATRTPLKNR